ncbi:hypothetical protein LguiB_023811 [Lonicera macranthoides]
MTSENNIMKMQKHYIQHFHSQKSKLKLTYIMFSLSQNFRNSAFFGWDRVRMREEEGKQDARRL